MAVDWPPFGQVGGVRSAVRGWCWPPPTSGCWTGCAGRCRGWPGQVRGLSARLAGGRSAV